MAPHISDHQCIIFFNFMKTYPDLAKGNYIGSKTEQKKLWQYLALSLNAYGPPIKNVRGWKQCWLSWRDYIKTRITENSCGSGQNILLPIEYQLAIVCDILPAVDYRIHNATGFRLPLLPLPDPESRLEPLQTASPTISRLSTIELTPKRKFCFQEEIQKEEKDETKDVEYITVQSEEINVSLEVIPDNSLNHSHASSSYTMPTLSSTSEVSSETKRKRSRSKEIYHSGQVHDTNNLKYVANEIKEINVTLENHTKQLKNINTTLEQMYSLKRQELKETKRHHLALERIALKRSNRN